MAARERERLRQAELESDRLREELETLANHLTHERAQREREKELARAREGAANDRVRLAQTRIVALEVRTMPDIPPPGVTRSLPPNPGHVKTGHRPFPRNRWVVPPNVVGRIPLTPSLPRSRRKPSRTPCTRPRSPVPRPARSPRLKPRRRPRRRRRS